MQATAGLLLTLPGRVSDQGGSLEPGKDADIPVATEVPTDPRTAFDIVFIDGRRW